jgi:hypothetical protein
MCNAKILLGDKGYDSNKIIEYAEKSGMQPIIPPQKNRKVQRIYDKIIYKKPSPREKCVFRT